MPNVFTANLPKALATSIQDQYDTLLPIFTKYANSEGNQYYTSVRTNYDIACLFLEMALFYKDIVVPMFKGSAAFMGFPADGISTIKIGNYVLTDTDRRKIRNMERDFTDLLTRYQIPIQMLLFSDLKSFARDLNGFFNSQYE